MTRPGLGIGLAVLYIAVILGLGVLLAGLWRQGSPAWSAHRW